jgi:hypothetical protein
MGTALPFGAGFDYTKLHRHSGKQHGMKDGCIRTFSRDEEKQDVLRNGLRNGNVRFYVDDIHDRDIVGRVMAGGG